MCACNRHRRWAFTLIELLVVIAIIALLMAILVPVLRNARNQTKAVVCQTNLKQWGSILNLYIEDNQSCFPCYDIIGNNESYIAWFLCGSIPGSDDQKDESLRPVEARGIACCPMAVGHRRSSPMPRFVSVCT
jgi:prepilin-type N-terminal cleavage/methylation domain-containing protein